MDLDVTGFEEPKPFTESEQQAIDDLKELCSQHSNIHFQLDNYFLTKFLRFRNWNAKDAFYAIVNYYTLKVNIVLLSSLAKKRKKTSKKSIVNKDFSTPSLNLAQSSNDLCQQECFRIHGDVEYAFSNLAGKT